MNVMDQAFEKLEISDADSDSEGEETDTPYKTDPILEAKVSYIPV